MAQNLQFCTFYLDKLLFGIPLTDVQEVMRHHDLTRVPLSHAVVSGLINLRGQIVGKRRKLELASQVHGSDEPLAEEANTGRRYCKL